MRLVGEREVRRFLDLEGAMAAVTRAFRSFAAGRAAVQERVRTSVGPVKLSTLGAVDLDGNIVGAKVYSTIGGQFRFVVLLFDAGTGAPLAAIEADAMTELRTAAVSAVVGRYAAPAARRMAAFGTGVQAGAHIAAFARVLPLEEVRVVSRGDATAFCRTMAERTGLPVVQRATAAALDGAEVVVTATRATEPLFKLGQLAPGAYVAAVGSTLPQNAEIGPDVVGSARVLVEWVPQTRREAGDLIRAAADGVFAWERAVEIGTVLAGGSPARTRRDEIVLFESVGIGLEDVACAAELWRRIAGEAAC